MTELHELEKIYKNKIKELKQRVRDMEQEDFSRSYDVDSYLKRSEAKKNASNYYTALEQMKCYGRGYVGFSFPDSWLVGMTKNESTIFTLRFSEAKSYKEIRQITGVKDVDQVYAKAYRIAMKNINNLEGDGK